MNLSLASTSLTPRLATSLNSNPSYKWMPDRRYDQNQLAAILRGAAEAQAKESSGGSEPDGVTLAEIERVASEVGIDPKFIAGAAARLDVAPKPKRFILGNTPGTEIFERYVDGDLSDAAWEEIVAELRAKFGSLGTTSLMGASREWVGNTDTRVVHLSATPRNGGTRFRLTLNQQGGVILAWLGVIMGSIFSAIFTVIASHKGGLAALPAVILIIGFVIAIALLVHMRLSKWHAENLRSVDEAMDQMEELTPRTAHLESREAGRTADESIANRINI